ncbi:MAG: prephenate dehydrogenase/arogenate dehydrogenase family protein [Verrucomicrobiota bacterium]
MRDDRSRIEQVCDDVEEAIAGADLVLLAMPTGVMADVVSTIGESGFEAGTLVTDVGSVKGSVMLEVAPLVENKGGHFLGSHPMAGSEKAGLEFAEATLFEKAPVIVTPPEGEDQDSENMLRLARFWETLGGVVSVCSAPEHDRIVASISHLPHLVAAALVRTVLKDDSGVAAFSGGGFRDTTRVAGGLEEMWSGILSDNQGAVSEKLGELIAELESWKEALDGLDRDQLRAFLSEARALRESL